MKSELKIFSDMVSPCYIATLDCCPGLSAFGDTKEEALLELSIALKLYMEVMIEDGDKLQEGL